MTRPQSSAARSRDAGLRTVSVLTRTLVAGSVVLSGVFAYLAAAAHPGKTKIAASSSATQARTPSATSPVRTARSHDDDGGDDSSSTSSASDDVPLSPPQSQLQSPPAGTNSLGNTGPVGNQGPAIVSGQS
jgi:hypothetical protein